MKIITILGVFFCCSMLWAMESKPDEKPYRMEGMVGGIKKKHRSETATTPKTVPNEAFDDWLTAGDLQGLFGEGNVLPKCEVVESVEHFLDGDDLKTLFADKSDNKTKQVIKRRQGCTEGYRELSCFVDQAQVWVKFARENPACVARIVAMVGVQVAFGTLKNAAILESGDHKLIMDMMQEKTENRVRLIGKILKITHGSFTKLVKIFAVANEDDEQSEAS